MESLQETIVRPKRNYLPEDLAMTDWGSVKGFYEELLHRDLPNKESLIRWLSDRSELDSMVEEEFRWRYVRRTCDTENIEISKAYEVFVSEVMPHLMQVANDLNGKITDSGQLENLDEDRFHVFIRGLKKRMELYRAENVPLMTELELISKEYDGLIGQITINWHNEELTIPQASKKLQEPDREIRSAVYTRINEQRLQEREAIHDILDRLIKKRHEVALNAGFENYRDYKMEELGRFDYTVQDCFQFQEAIAKEVVPVIELLYRKRKSRLGVEQLRPYDLSVDISGQPPQAPFKDTEELIGKTAHCLLEVDPFFSECLRVMQAMGYLDLDSRKGKAPGGYNMAMPEIGVPFVFMNAAGSPSDVRTMVHEMGHAVHSFLTRDLEYEFDKEVTSEVAELASMSMELFTLEGQRTFYNSAEGHQRAVQDQLENTLVTLVWIAIIDKFQHWLYTHPEHSWDEREAAWVSIHKEFSPDIIDWSGFEPYRAILWQKQMHIFEVPFYYIEYGIARLGSLGMWLNYQRDARRTIENYKSALRLGYTKTIPQIYAEAGVPFNFSQDHVRHLVRMVSDKLQID